MPALWIVTASKTMSSGFFGGIGSIFGTLSAFLWDTALTLLNIIAPRKQTKVNWPEYVPRTKSDSRGPCPFLNALANHGVLPHDGRNVTFRELGRVVNQYYNFSPSFCYFVCNDIATILKRNYKKDSFDLSDMSVHNGIEHDGSITRGDTAFQPDQSYPDEVLIKAFLASSQNGKTLTAADCSRFLAKRYSDSKRDNGQFSLSTFHRLFGASNAATMLRICGGDVEDLRSFLIEERCPEGWYSKTRTRFGLTIGSFNTTVFRVFLGIDPAWKRVKCVPKNVST